MDESVRSNATGKSPDLIPVNNKGEPEQVQILDPRNTSRDEQVNPEQKFFDP
jgi:hypothetical protein